VTNCTIKIYDRNSGIIYRFFSTQDKNTFSQRIEVHSDTLCILVSHVGYQDTVILCPLTLMKQWAIEIRLRIRADLLNPITLQSPPVWKRGDTTFFKANHFKRGDETRLKDLIVSLPGFYLSEDGTLFYKNRQVDKILINGQDMFAGETRLLLNNFPVHVLKTIQAIENQNGDRLLQGLGQSTHTVLNLGLTADRRSVLFGAMEAGIGSMDKYSLNPVAFDVSGKIKMGLVANRENTGVSLGTGIADELFGRYEKEASSWMMQPASPTMIPGFETKWYIDNDETYTKLQVDLPFGKGNSSKTEIGVLTDEQTQSNFLNQSVLAGNVFENK